MDMHVKAAKANTGSNYTPLRPISFRRVSTVLRPRQSELVSRRSKDEKPLQFSRSISNRVVTWIAGIFTALVQLHYARAVTLAIGTNTAAPGLRTLIPVKG